MLISVIKPKYTLEQSFIIRDMKNFDEEDFTKFSADLLMTPNFTEDVSSFQQLEEFLQFFSKIVDKHAKS